MNMYYQSILRIKHIIDTISNDREKINKIKEELGKLEYPDLRKTSNKQWLKDCD